MPKIYLDSLRNAIAALELGFAEQTAYPQLLTLRDGVIQRFDIFPLEVLHGMLLTWFDCYSCEHEGWERTFAAQGLLQC